MNFEDFYKKIKDDSLDSSEYYKLYLEIKLIILQTIVMNKLGIDDDFWNSIEEDTFNKAIKRINNRK